MEIKTNRILITSFASNVARMESVFYCAKKTGRNICLVGRSMQRGFTKQQKMWLSQRTYRTLGA